jgi:hypothetical protein
MIIDRVALNAVQQRRKAKLVRSAQMFCGPVPEIGASSLWQLGRNLHTLAQSPSVTHVRQQATVPFSFLYKHARLPSHRDRHRPIFATVPYAGGVLALDAIPSDCAVVAGELANRDEHLSRAAHIGMRSHPIGSIVQE